MSVHLLRQVEQLKKMILSLGAMVEESFQGALSAIDDRDPDLARKVIDSDQEIDLYEIEVEEECLHILALNQPVAFDMRYIVAVLKINNDLERIGDLSVNIAEQAHFLADGDPLSDMPFDIDRMSSLVRQMLRKALDALVNIDISLAEEVRQMDDQVDDIHRMAYERVCQSMREQPHQIELQMNMMNVSRNLERIADHAVNIAEDVLYMARGDIMRHNRPHPLRTAEG